MKKYKGVLLRLIPFLLATALTIILSEIFYQNMIASTTEKCWEELSASHNQSAREIGTRLNNNIKMLNLASEAIMFNADLEDEQSVLTYLASVKTETIFDRIDVMFPDGTILVETGDHTTGQGDKNYPDLAAKGAHVSGRMADFYTGQETIRVYSPVRDARGETIAVLGGSLYCSTMAEVFSGSYYGNKGQQFLVDLRDGNLVLDLWHETPGSIYDMLSYEDSGEQEDGGFIGDIMAGKSGNFPYDSQHYGKTSYTVYGPVPDTQLTLVMVVQEEDVFREVYDLKETLSRVGVVEVGLLLFFAVWIYFILSRSMESESRAQKAELALLHQKEEELESQYAEATKGRDFLAFLAVNLPGGYHRCTTDHSFRLTFVSNSFTQVTGYTLEQVNRELDGSYLGLVAPEDRDYFLSLAPQLEREGYIHCAYRIRRRDGSIRWVQDSTQYVEQDGDQYYQCALSDIHDIILKQEELARQANMLDILETNMPGGYHRCADAPGWPFLYISTSFEEVTGWSREEIREQFGNQFINMVLPEDLPRCAGIIEEIRHRGYSNAIYRLKKKGGGTIWVSDSTMGVALEQGSFFHGVLADVSNQAEEMERAKQAAEASSRAKSTFLFNISHDIRTPMNAIKGFSHIIAQNAENPGLVLDAVGKIHKASDALMMLMNDVLDIARIERGKEELNLQPVELCAHGKSLWEMFAADMEEAGIRFVRAEELREEYVYCDQLKLTRILMNMLSNAKKFTPPGGTVTFGCTRLCSDGKHGTYRFYVWDTGIGMSADFQQRAFEQFERERTSTESGVSGSGLGLAIIKMLVDLMGGTVELQSELGKGTKIDVTLTFRLAERPPETQTNAQPGAAVDMAGKRILLVEDNDFNREIARYILEDMAFTVEEAENGAVCIEKLQAAGAGYYDLILMDIQMPVMDGYTAAAQIRKLADSRLAGIPMIAMTANAFEEDRQKCLDVGMNGHIGKPVEMDKLIRMLRVIFS